MSDNKSILSLTPILPCDAVAPCLTLWKSLGFEVTAEVPGEDGKPQFVMLGRDDVTIMYQTRASIADDLGDGVTDGATCVYLVVDALDDIIARLHGVELAMAERETFYGTREIAVRDAAGHWFTFAERVAGPDADESTEFSE